MQNNRLVNVIEQVLKKGYILMHLNLSLKRDKRKHNDENISLSFNAYRNGYQHAKTKINVKIQAMHVVIPL